MATGGDDMLQNIETFELPERFRTLLSRGVLAIGIVALASAMIGTLIT